jgi:hypothetical protein
MLRNERQIRSAATTIRCHSAAMTSSPRSEQPYFVPDDLDANDWELPTFRCVCGALGPCDAEAVKSDLIAHVATGDSGSQTKS